MDDKKLISRLRIIIKENGGQVKTGGLIGVSQSYLSRVLVGERDLNAETMLGIIIKLGYTPEWLLLGTGDRKNPGKYSTKLVTEIQYFRTELEIYNKKVDLLNARMKGYEGENEALKKEIEALKNGAKNGGK